VVYVKHILFVTNLNIIFALALRLPPPPFPPKYDVSETDPFPRHQVVFTKPQVSGLCHICCKTLSSETNCLNATVISPTQWPRLLKRGSAAAGLLGLRIRIPPKTRTSFCCKCCVLSGRGHYDGPITRPEESYRVWRVRILSRSFNLEEPVALLGCLAIK
jgi:hypothetical protein